MVDTNNLEPTMSKSAHDRAFTTRKCIRMPDDLLTKIAANSKETNYSAWVIDACEAKLKELRNVEHKC